MNVALGLRARLVGAVLFVLVLLLVSIAAFVVLRAEAALAEVDRARFGALARQLAEQVSYGVLAEKPALLEAPLAAFAQSADLVEVVITTDEGAVLATTRGAAPAGDVPVVVVDEIVRTKAGFAGEGSEELEAFGLAADAAKVTGAVRATFSTAATARVQARVRNEIVATFVVLGSLGLGLVLLLASSVVRRVRLLEVGAARVSRGEVDVVVEDRGGDELAALARDFNAMAASLQRQRAELAEREGLAAIGRATAVIAHELRNPLGIVLGAAEIVGNAERPEEQKRRAAAILVDETKRLSQTLDGLLAYARPQAPTKSACSVLALARSTADRAALPGGPAEGKRVVVQGDDVRALIDEAQIGQVLWNVVQNAAQAGAASVTLHVARAGGNVRVVVEDDGPGVAGELADRLFLPFVTTKQRGAGLGLAAARRSAREHGGDLRLEPAGRGARFVLELPAEVS